MEPFKISNLKEKRKVVETRKKPRNKVLLTYYLLFMRQAPDPFALIKRKQSQSDIEITRGALEREF